MTTMGRLRSVEAVVQSKPNLKIYEGDFHLPTVRPGDMDGIVEVRGFFLVHEYKHIAAAPNEGQAILFKALREKKDFVTIEITHNGDCWDMDFTKAVFTVPKSIDLFFKNGEKQMTVEKNVMDYIHTFHKCWTKYAVVNHNLKIRGKR